MAKSNAKRKSNRFWIFVTGKMDYSLIVITLLLLSIGLIILLSASAPTSIAENGNGYSYALKQGLVAIVGLGLMFLFSTVDYKCFKSWKWLIYIGCVVMLLIVGLFGIGENGARRWFKFPIIGTLQPSEFVKVGLVLFYAAFLTDIRDSNRIKKLVPGFITPFVLFIPVAIILYKLQNHLSATLIMAMVMTIQIFIAGANISYFVGTAGIGGALVALYALSSAMNPEEGGFRTGRIQTWLNIEADATGAAWQINQSLYAIGSGGLFGLGLGESRQKYLYLPEPQNDFIFAILAEELGFIGCITVIILFIAFVWRGILIAMKAKDTFGSLIAIGITSIIGLQALINIAVVTNTIPVTGMPLPFFSHGGSALLANLIGVGILLSVSRNSKK